MPHRRPLFALLAFALVLLSIPALAQIDKASIEAVALDQRTAALPGVIVTLVRLETGYETSAVTDSAGMARFFVLAPGNYEVSFALEGFAPLKAQKLKLFVGQTGKVAVTMQQSASETITVSADAPIVDVHKTDSSSNILPEQIASRSEEHTSELQSHSE